MTAVASLTCTTRGCLRRIDITDHYLDRPLDLAEQRGWQINPALCPTCVAIRERRAS